MLSAVPPQYRSTSPAHPRPVAFIGATMAFFGIENMQTLDAHRTQVRPAIIGAMAAHHSTSSTHNPPERFKLLWRRFLLLQLGRPPPALEFQSQTSTCSRHHLETLRFATHLVRIGVQLVDDPNSLATLIADGMAASVATSCFLARSWRVFFFLPAPGKLADIGHKTLDSTLVWQ